MTQENSWNDNSRRENSGSIKLLSLSGLNNFKIKFHFFVIFLLRETWSAISCSEEQAIGDLDETLPSCLKVFLITALYNYKLFTWRFCPNFFFQYFSQVIKIVIISLFYKINHVITFVIWPCYKLRIFYSCDLSVIISLSQRPIIFQHLQSFAFSNNAPWDTTSFQPQLSIIRLADSYLRDVFVSPSCLCDDFHITELPWWCFLSF